jgi:ATP phosphoribosyltransferase regulatory subunit
MMEFLKIKDRINYCKNKYNLKKEIEGVFTSRGYENIEPETFEDYESVLTFSEILKKESVVKVVSDNSKIVILRPDITLNILRNLIPLWEMDLKLKLFYDSTVYRNRTNSNVKEFEQMGIEYLGEDPLLAGKEVIETALIVLKKYSRDFILELGNSKYLNGVLKEINADENEINYLKNLIFKKSRFEIAEYIKQLNLKNEIHDILLNILSFQGSLENVVKNAESFYMNKEMKEAVDELKAINDLIQNDRSKHIYFDLSMVTEIDYYEGVVFKGYFKNSTNEILSGGRYDSLTEKFGKRISAVGFSIYIDDLVKAYFEGGDVKWI